MTLPSVRGMRSDLRQFLPDMTRREKVTTWVRFYWWPTRRWVSKLAAWWDERRYGPVPPIEKDRVALHHGFVDGAPPCTDGPVCAAHGWALSPLVAQHEKSSNSEPHTSGDGTIGPPRNEYGSTLTEEGNR